MTDFKVGDRVRIRKESRYYGINRANPKDTVGVITQDRRWDPSTEYMMHFRVKWENDTSNAYNVEDLELVGHKSRSKLTQFIKQWEKQYDAAATSR
jgi:hypothetical protein